MICVYCYDRSCRIPVRRCDSVAAIKVLVTKKHHPKTVKDMLLRVAFGKGTTDCHIRSLLHNLQPAVYGQDAEALQQAAERLVGKLQNECA